MSVRSDHHAFAAGRIDHIDKVTVYNVVARVVGRYVSPEVATPPPIVGRDDLLHDLRAAFLAERGPLRPVMRVLTGTGGIGKTSTARAYAHHFHDTYHHILWIHAENPAVIDGEFRAPLEILVGPDDARVQDAIGALHALLAAQTQPWLLVLDNVPDADALARLIPAAGPGHVLVTTQSTRWAAHTVLPVTPLDRRSAADLLRELSGDTDHTAADELADELGGLPLAVAQAGSYAHVGELSLADYLMLYRARRKDLQGKGKLFDNYPHTVATTWTLAVDRLPSDARALLNVLSFYAPDNIPVRLLLTPSAAGEPALTHDLRPPLVSVLTDPIARQDALATLLDFSLATRAPDNTVTVHRLVQAHTRDQLDVDNPGNATTQRLRWAAAALAVLAAALPQPPPTAHTLNRWKRLSTHGPAVLTHTEPEHPDTLAARSNLASWTGEAGDVPVACDLFAALLSDRIRLLGPEHPDTLSTRSYLGYWTGQAGDAPAARDLFAALLPDYERLLGPEHPDTLITRNNLASWTGHAGDASAARDLYAALLPDHERLLGAEHPHTLIIRNNLASWTGEAGDASVARDLFAALLSDRIRLLGAEHPHTLVTRSNLAFWTGHAGDAPAARDLFAALLPDHERLLGPEHPHTLITRGNLAYWGNESSR